MGNKLCIGYKHEVTEAFKKYQENKSEKEWEKDHCSVFKVTATEENGALPETTFILTGYEILKAFFSLDLDLTTIDTDELWELIVTTSDVLLESHL